MASRTDGASLEPISFEPASVNIGPLEAQDLPDALALQKMAFMSEAVIYGNYRLPPLEEDFAELQREYRGKTFLAAWLERRLVGVIRGLARDGTGFIERLAVHPAHRRRGIGAALVTALERTLNCARFELFTGEQSVENIRLYERLGYHRLARRALEPGLQLMLMEKP